MADSERFPVLYLIDKLHRAGAQNNLRQLVSGLDRSRFSPTVCCLVRGGALAEALEREGVEVQVLGVERLYGPRAISGLKRLASLMRERDVRLVHTYLVSANIFGTLAAKRARAPVILTTRRDMGFSRNWRLKWLEETFINPRVSGVVVPCEAIAEVARREKHLSAGRVVTIPNGIDATRWRLDEDERKAARRGLGLVESETAIGVIANFLPIKGHADFLEAATRVLATHPQTRFLLAGEGEIRATLEARATRLGLGDRVVFLGRRDDTRELLAALDLTVLPSHSEGMSNVLLEAMAMARPIVATAVGGNPELLKHDVTGLLVPPREPAALAEAMTSLLLDRARAARLGREARRVAETRFSLREMVSRYEALYASLLRK